MQVLIYILKSCTYRYDSTYMTSYSAQAYIYSIMDSQQHNTTTTQEHNNTKKTKQRPGLPGNYPVNYRGTPYIQIFTVTPVTPAM